MGTALVMGTKSVNRLGALVAMISAARGWEAMESSVAWLWLNSQDFEVWKAWPAAMTRER